jgi:transcriptional regulator GlxA family with amidase domain
MNFGIVIFNDVEALDFVGPWEMVAIWTKYFKGPERCLIVAEEPGAVVCSKGLSVNPDVSFEDCPPLDFILIPGGAGTRQEVGNPRMIDFVATHSKNCKAILSVCTGSFILHAAGLLRGKKATTHWSSLQRMRELGDIEVVEQRFVRDGDIWTSAGVSAGTDLILAFIADFAGTDVAGKVQSTAEYYPDDTLYGSFQDTSQAPAYIRTRVR